MAEARRSARPVYIIDDDAVVRRSTSFLLSSARYQPRAFMAAGDFLDEAHLLAPGCVLVDIRMPELDGLSFLERFPDALRLRFPIIMITAHGDLPSAVRAMKLGARDFLEKPFEEAALLGLLGSLSDELASALMADGARQDALGRIARLTPRESEFLRTLVEGQSTKQAAHALGISVRTAEMHRGNLFDHLGVRSVAEAIRIAVQAGWLPR
ncbi:response regulator [Sphingomonas sp. GM_Shp_1]|uniref:response regulator transcription factor n=1 Tax=Sphingomonas sp. GM_Shp_1 TaxID=2937381 RepID=UPI00226BA752|nr:response regulator [Sphingomonas sp. GM_Shp_1]